MTEFTTPGQLISSLLEERGWTQQTLSVILEKHEGTINRIISGKAPVTTDTAIALEDVFSVPAEDFLRLQKSYDLAVARLSTKPDPGRATRAKLFGDLPIADMIKRGWLETDDPHNLKEVEKALVKFFGVKTADEIEILPHAAKKTAVNTETTPAQLAWLYRVQRIASEMIVERYSEKKLRAALTGLKVLMTAPEEARNAPRLLAECGVRFVIVQALPKAKIDGVCFWLDNNSPVIALTMRHDRIDNFWFVLRHEIEHVLQGDGKREIVIDVELEGERAGTGPDVLDEERIANAAAENFCVPRSEMDGFIARKAPFFSERDMKGFSRSLGVHPGIVAGQLQHRTKRYDRFRQHLLKIRSCVAPSAMIDGWGDIAPVGL